jgi:hypothetical protein
MDGVPALDVRALTSGDPWGHLIEQWTDGDFFAGDVPPSVTDIPTMLGRQWGPPAPPDFV